MPDSTIEMIKQREIRFSALPPERQVAEEAMGVVSELHGVLYAAPSERRILTVHYDVSLITREFIDTLLRECGFHLDNTLMSKFTRALHYYTEEALRANLGVGDCCSNTHLQVYVNRYQQLRHGCRDRRPEHWREYL